MDPDRPVVDDGQPLAIVCPFEILRDAAETFAETGRLFVAGLAESSALPSSVGRSLTSAIEANGVLFEQLAQLSRRSAQPRSRQRAADVPRGESQTARAVILRAKPGEEATGAFVLENVRAEPVTATVLPTAFVDSDGNRVNVELQLEPSQVELAAGEEAVVRVGVTVPRELRPDISLRGAIHVPGLTTVMVPVVISAE